MAVPSSGAKSGRIDSVVLALNSGSSSLKFGLYEVHSSHVEVLLTGRAESIGEQEGQFHVRDSHDRPVLAEKGPIPTQRDAMIRIERLLTQKKFPPPSAIGHRIVHGGPKLRAHCIIDAMVLREMEAACAFAPLHMPQALEVMGLARDHFPGLVHVACFDTAFHAAMPDVARVLPIAKELQSEGVWRYGFHGLSCESILHQLRDQLPRRLVVAHLGNGASVTAVKDGKSIDTSMGLTPTGGVIMSTRSGDLDPGVLLYLLGQKRFDIAMLANLIDYQSGLLGISGVASDMRRLHQLASLNANARLAIEMFCYSVAKQVAAMISALGGLDLLVFTGGIGENDPAVRAVICNRLSWFGVTLDAAQNGRASNPISDARSRCQVLVLVSEEDLQIARHTEALIPK